MKKKVELIAIGASTGGTEATLKILSRLPAKIPAMVITQHMPQGFTQMYANRLNEHCAFQVREATNGERLKPGLCLLAPGGEHHLSIIRVGPHLQVHLTKGEKVNGHRPSVDVLFQSVATALGSAALGVILTGMGNDGANGLLQMRKAGAFTIAQDKESCVVYGMPMVANNLGAASVSAPLEQIAGLITTRLF